MTEDTDEGRRDYVVGGTAMRARPLEPALYIVSTPIGNLGDMTLRGIETLAAADVLACEDTRVTRVLLDRYGISRRPISYHEHNAAEAGEKLIAALSAGKSVALVSDAGTPLVSDPGFRLVGEAREAGIRVVPIPGASAVLAALAASGLPTDAFAFHGFLPPKAGTRANALKKHVDSRETLVFYESPRRLADTLSAMAEVLGDRQAAVSLELTKRFERAYRGLLSELIAQFGDDEIKGEAVITVAGAAAPSAPSEEDWQAALTAAMANQPLRAAVDEVAAQYNLKRKDVYNAALALKDAD